MLDSEFYDNTLSFNHEQDYNQKAALSDIDSLQTISIQTFKETLLR
jgi:hypothetical protein